MPEPDIRRKNLFSTLRLLLLLVLLVCGFAWYMHYYMNQRTAGGQQIYDNLAVFDARLQNLETSFGLHEKRIKDLEEGAQKQANTPPSPAPATAPSAGTAPAADNDRIAALEKDITTLKAGLPLQNGDNINQAIRLLSAFHRLSDKVIGGKQFASELSAFEELATPDQSTGSPLATLAPYADSGIPTFATLLVSFDQSVESLNAAEAVPPASAGFWERLKYNLMHLVSVRRIDDSQTGGTENAIVGRAQAHLEREEIEAAVAEIKSLPENVRGNFAAWLDDAQMVMDAPSLIDQIEEQVMQKAFHAEAPAPTPAPPPAKPPEQTPPPPAPKT